MPGQRRAATTPTCGPLSAASGALAILALGSALLRAVPVAAQAATGATTGTSGTGQGPAGEQLVVTGLRGDGVPAGSAAAVGFTHTPLSALQPTSVVGEAQIRDNVAPVGGYDDVVRLTPSVLTISPNGPGLSEAAVASIRGFQDGQYNVTFDGIPFGDTDDFTHHSNVYFTPDFLSRVSIDRGPGTASTIGNATFGGTVAVLSRRSGPQTLITPYATAGSDRTGLAGLAVESGTLPGGGSFVLDGSTSRSDGTLANTPSERSSLFFKGEQPLGETLTLTLAAVATRLREADSPGATRAEIASFGPDYALSTDPASRNFSGYNTTVYNTNFAYLGLAWRPRDDLAFEDKLYTYGLDRHLGNGLDVNGQFTNGTLLGPDDVPGQNAKIGLRAVGDVLDAVRSFSFGTLKLGLWAERQANSRSQFQVDDTLGGALDPTLAPVAGLGPAGAAADRIQQETLVTVQPFAQFDWAITSRLTLSAGVKYAVSDRSIEAPVMQGTRLPLDYGAQFAAPLPAVALNWRIRPGWSAYLQVARGFLPPTLEFFDTPTPSSRQLSPELTWNYQLGTVWQGRDLSASLDGYYIDFQNFENVLTVGEEPVVSNEGDVDFLGLEADATCKLGGGLALSGNGSLNSARERRGGEPVPNAPQATLAGGLLFERGAWRAALIDKWVGRRYGDTDRQQGLDPFNQLDLSLGWNLPPTRPGRPPVKLKLLASNILDARKIDALAGFTAGGAALFYTQAGRTVLLSTAVPF